MAPKLHFKGLSDKILLYMLNNLVIKIDQSPEQYKAQTFGILKAEIMNFFIGLIVVASVVLAVFFHISIREVILTAQEFPQNMIMATMKALTPPPTSSLDVNRFIKSNGGGFTGKQIMPEPTKKASTESGQIRSISSGKVTNTSKTYTVKEGDTLVSIALETFGDEQAWTTIAAANNLSETDALEVGVVLKIPKK
jgi:hypothetical protein